MIFDRFEKSYFFKTRDFLRLYLDFCDSKPSPESFSFFLSLLFLKYFSEYPDDKSQVKIPENFSFSRFLLNNPKKDSFETACRALSKFFSANFPEDTKHTKIIDFRKTLSFDEDLPKKTNILIMQLEQKKYSLEGIFKDFFKNLFKTYQSDNFFPGPGSRTHNNAFKVIFSLIEKTGYEYVIFSGTDNGIFFDYWNAENYKFNDKIFVSTSSVYFWLILKLLTLSENAQKIKILGPLDSPPTVKTAATIHFPQSFSMFRRLYWYNNRSKFQHPLSPFSTRERISFETSYSNYIKSDRKTLFDWRNDVFLFVDAKTLTDDKIKNVFFELFNQNNIDTVVRLPNRFFSGNYMQAFIFVLKENKKEENILFIDSSYLTKGKTRNDIDQDMMEKISEIYTERKELGSVSKIFTDLENFKSNIFMPIISGDMILKTEEKIKKIKQEILKLERRIRDLEYEFERSIEDDLLNKIISSSENRTRTDISLSARS